MADESTKGFLAEAMRRFRIASDAESRIRHEALDDLQFSIGEQWPDDVERTRTEDARPCLVINRMPEFIRQATNQQRQNRPAIHINPIGDGATKDTAEILQGIVRHIERNSEAGVAYDHAFDRMIRSRIGYFRILTDYADDESFEQEIFIRRIKNPFTVYFDPSCQETDYSDAKWAFVIEDVPRRQFKEMYPRSELAGLEALASIGDQPAEWITEESVRVAEYFYVEEEPKTVYLLADGSKSEVLPEGFTALAEREVTNRKVKWCKITAMEILEKRDWPGRWIPIVPVLGDDIDVNGRRHLAGLVTHAKDAQRMSNYWKSHATEAIALAPRSPWVAAEGQIEDYKDYWETANVKNWAVLPYKPTDIKGQPVPPPQRNFAEPPIQAVAAMIRDSDKDLHDTTGIYPPSLGGESNETSGRAILAKQSQTNVSLFGFMDNLARSVRHGGRIILELIPKTYTEARIQRIVKPDTSVDQVVVYNGEEQQPQAQQLMNEQIKRIYNIGLGRYDVTVSTGPTYESKRQEAAASMVEFLRVFPQAAPVMGDLMVRSMDWPGADDIADRLKKMLPPELLQDETGDPKIKLQQMQAQLQQLMQQHELLVKALNEAREKLEQKTIEIESKERIAAMDNQTKLVLAQIQLEREGAMAMLKAQLEAINSRLELLKQEKPVEATTQ